MRKFLETGRQSGTRHEVLRATHVASPGRAPTPALGESLDLLSSGFQRVGTALLPYVDAARTEGEALLVGETMQDHR